MILFDVWERQRGESGANLIFRGRIPSMTVAACRNTQAGHTAVRSRAASASQMGRFETEWLVRSDNVAAPADLPGQWIDAVHQRRQLKVILLDMDSEFEKLYAFVRNLIAKLPPPGDGKAFALDDEVALRFFRLQQMTEGSIELSDGEADPLKGPTDVGTAHAPEEQVALSSLIDKLNERFGTAFTEADRSP
jgi:hypothetical protein